MKIIGLSTILLSFSFALSAQMDFSSAHKMSLKGDVSSVRSDQYSVTFNPGGSTSSLYYILEQDTFGCTEYFYDGNGKIEEQRRFSEPGVVASKTLFDYDGDGIGTGWKDCNSSGMMQSYGEYGYENGKRTSVEAFDTLGNAMYAVKFVWDGDNMSETIFESHSTPDPYLVEGNYTMSYEYENGNLYRAVTTRENEIPIYVIFDSDGNSIEENSVIRSWDIDKMDYDVVEKIIVNSYEFDNKGNWIVQTRTYKLTGESEGIVKHEIVYNDEIE